VCLDEICDNGLDDDADGRIDCEDRECREIPECSASTAGEAIDFSVRASSEKEGNEAALVGDKDPNTRWWTERNHRQWLKLDLGGIYPVDRVDINWHDNYADHYRIRLSKNGRYWKNVKEVNSGNGGLDSNTFGTREARFVLIQCKSGVGSGFSIYEVEVFRGTDD
jgi:hypothetical protein